MKDQRRLLLAAERRRLEPNQEGSLRVGIGYPNSYHVAMSSLAYQWVLELTGSVTDVGVDRFFSEVPGDGRGFDSGNPLYDLDVLAWSCSFELDAANLLATLDAAGIPRRREERDHRHPLLVMGGAVASINPLPMAPAIDVFVIGSAELLWPPLLELIRETPERGRLLEKVAGLDGYFVPEHHLDSDGHPKGRRRRVEKRNAEMNNPAMVPVSHAVTPFTEYRNRGLVEMSRGCPEKCRYCWVSYNYGRLRCYPKDGILDAVNRLRGITDRVGFVATAVGDHPQLAEILDECRRLELNVALSSLRIPAMRADVLRPLAESGARSVTIAPETGTDALRVRLNKPISNDAIVHAVETAQGCGIVNLKMYFIIGLPGETDDDLIGIAELLKRTQAVMLAHGRERGLMGTLQAGFNILVPKPYTPYSREPMLSKREARRRMEIIERSLGGLANCRIGRPSYRESLWQGYLSRGGASAFPALERVAAGEALGSVVSGLKQTIEESTLHRVEGVPPWRFISSAPQVGRQTD